MAYSDYSGYVIRIEHFCQLLYSLYSLCAKGLCKVWFPTRARSREFSESSKALQPAFQQTSKRCFSGVTFGCTWFGRQHLFFRLKWYVALFSFCLIHPVAMVSLQPNIDLDAGGYGTYLIHLDNETINLEYHPDGIIIYNADLVKERQLYSVSKLLDLTESSLANQNVINSLSQYSEAQDFGQMNEFTLLDGYEFFVSDYVLPYEECTILCASKGSLVIFDPAHYYRLTKKFPGKSFWLNTQTRVDRKDGNVLSYHVYFGNKQIFPVNRLNKKGAAKIYYQHEGSMKQVSKIATYYDNYFNSQSNSYWSKEAYRLQAAVSATGKLSIYIPTKDTILPGDDFASCCGCSRKLSHSRRIYHDMSTELTKVGIQQSKLNISIEHQRLRTGDVMRLITPSLHKELTFEMESAMANGTYTIKDIAPLAVVSNDTNDKLLLPSAVSFTAKAVGVPLLQKGFQHYMRKFSAEVKGKMIDYVSRNNFQLPTSVQLSGLHAEVSNFSLRLKFDNIHSYEGNITASMDGSTRLLRNLSITNVALESFLHNHAMEYMIALAQQDMPLDIDTSMPFIAVVHPSQSFIIFKFFFSCILPDPAVTIYETFSLPHKKVSQELQSLDVPDMFSTNNFNYEFESERQQNKGLPQCIDAILSGHIADTCEISTFTNRRIVKGLSLSNYYVFYILTADNGAQLKIDCPRFKQVNIKCTHMVTVVAVSPACALGLTTSQGTLTMKRNNSYTGKIRKPFYLFAYDLTLHNSSDYYQFVLLITVVVVVSILLLIMSIAVYYVFCYKVSEVLTTTDTYTPFGSMETVRGVSFAPNPPQ